MPEGRSKKRFTVAVDPSLALALDFRARGAGMTRSAAVEEAISCWLRVLAEEDAEGLDGYAGRPKRGRGGGAEVAARMVLEALRYQFPAMRDLSDAELRRRATSGGAAHGTKEDRRGP